MYCKIQYSTFGIFYSNMHFITCRHAASGQEAVIFSMNLLLIMCKNTNKMPPLPPQKKYMIII